MALPKQDKHVLRKLQKLGPEVVDNYQKYILELAEELGFVGTKRLDGNLEIVGGMVRFQHPERGVHLWVARRYVRIFSMDGVKKTDIAILPITEARDIYKALQ